MTAAETFIRMTEEQKVKDAEYRRKKLAALPPDEPMPPMIPCPRCSGSGVCMSKGVE